MAASTITLTKLQAEELAHRLSIHEDEGWAPFGVIAGQVITVADFDSLLSEIEDLLEVAYDNADEAPVGGYVRSFKLLTAKVEAARLEAAVDHFSCEGCGGSFVLQDDTFSEDWHSYEDFVTVYFCDTCSAPEFEPVAVRAKLVCEEFEQGLRWESESAAALRDLGVFTRTVAPKTGTRKHHEIVAPTEKAAIALASYVYFWSEHYAGCARDGSGGNWSETREILSKRDAFARAHKRLSCYSRK